MVKGKIYSKAGIWRPNPGFFGDVPWNQSITRKFQQFITVSNCSFLRMAFIFWGNINLYGQTLAQRALILSEMVLPSRLVWAALPFLLTQASAYEAGAAGSPNWIGEFTGPYSSQAESGRARNSRTSFPKKPIQWRKPLVCSGWEWCKRMQKSYPLVN